MEAYHTQDEELRGVNLQKVRPQLVNTVKVLELLNDQFGEIRDGTQIIPGTE